MILTPITFSSSLIVPYNTGITVYPHEGDWYFEISYAAGEYTAYAPKGCEGNEAYPSSLEAKKAALVVFIRIEKERFERLKEKLESIGLEI